MCFASLNSRSEFPKLKKSKKRRRREAPFGDAFWQKFSKKNFSKPGKKWPAARSAVEGHFLWNFCVAKISHPKILQSKIFRKFSDRLLVDRCSEIFILKNKNFPFLENFSEGKIFKFFEKSHSLWIFQNFPFLNFSEGKI